MNFSRIDEDGSMVPGVIIYSYCHFKATMLYRFPCVSVHLFSFTACTLQFNYSRKKKYINYVVVAFANETFFHLAKQTRLVAVETALPGSCVLWL